MADLFIFLETNPGGMFAINETTGNITLFGSLDRKTQSFYALLVSVSFTTANKTQFGLGSLLCFEGLSSGSPGFLSNQIPTLWP
jgi:hypothetical protein